MSKRNMSDKDRFLQYVKEDANGCWIWQASTMDGQRGQFRINGTMELAHRVSYLLFVGPIPDGLCVCHSCDVPLCVNPEHLWLGTIADNNADRDRKGRTRFKPNRGEENGRAKLTDSQIASIIWEASVEGVSQSKLAAKYGVVQPHISRIVRGIAWKHLPSDDFGSIGQDSLMEVGLVL